jgi:hypothetical protein
VGLGLEKLRPRRSGPSWRGVDPGGIEDLPHGGGADLVAQACEFAVHPSVSPGRVLGGEVYCRGPQPWGYGWSAWPVVGGGPVAGNEPSVSAQDRGGRDEQTGPVAGQPAAECSDRCSVGPVHPGSRGAAVQYGELVAQHEDLDVLGPPLFGRAEAIQPTSWVTIR